MNSNNTDTPPTEKESGYEIHLRIALDQFGFCASNHVSGRIELRFNKSSGADLNIYCQRDGESERVLLGQAVSGRFVDDSPLMKAGEPEARRYRAVCVFNGVETGEISDEIVITCRALR